MDHRHETAAVKIEIDYGCVPPVWRSVRPSALGWPSWSTGPSSVWVPSSISNTSKGFPVFPEFSHLKQTSQHALTVKIVWRHLRYNLAVCLESSLKVKVVFTITKTLQSMIKISIEFSSHPLSDFIIALKPIQNSFYTQYTANTCMKCKYFVLTPLIKYFITLNI